MSIATVSLSERTMTECAPITTVNTKETVRTGVTKSRGRTISKSRKRLNKSSIRKESKDFDQPNNLSDEIEPPSDDFGSCPSSLKFELLNFFDRREYIDRFLPVINRTSPVSLRLLDYFCVNYSRSAQVTYTIRDQHFDVYSSYKNQLKTFSKKRFDPFRRNSRITFKYGNENFDTTIGQLCFFKWCLTHHVLDYVEKNITAISEDMKKNGGKPLNEPGSIVEKKRRSSRKSSMTLAATRVPTPPGMDSVIVTFD
jgi:hypothetical protein